MSGEFTLSAKASLKSSSSSCNRLLSSHSHACPFDRCTCNSTIFPAPELDRYFLFDDILVGVTFPGVLLGERGDFGVKRSDRLLLAMVSDSYGCTPVIMNNKVRPAEKMSIGNEKGEGGILTTSGLEYWVVPRPIPSSRSGELKREDEKSPSFKLNDVSICRG